MTPPLNPSAMRQIEVRAHGADMFSKKSGAGGAADSANELLNTEFLRTLIETMLPKQAATVYGKGLAGDVSRSFLAEQIAREIGRSGSVPLLGGRP